MKSRPYQQRARAASAQATADAIIASTLHLFLVGGDSPTLEAVAHHAGVSVQTVLRRFGSKQELYATARKQTSDRVAAERGRAPVGDITGAIENLLEHYAEWGATSMRVLALEQSSDSAREVATDGRALHRAWVEHVFAPFIADRSAADRERSIVQLVVVTDVYTWHLLSTALALPPAEVGAHLRELVQRILN